jgi:hypothetical protein
MVMLSKNLPPIANKTARMINNKIDINLHTF